jgi:hypothetical protein
MSYPTELGVLAFSQASLKCQPVEACREDHGWRGFRVIPGCAGQCFQERVLDSELVPVRHGLIMPARRRSGAVSRLIRDRARVFRRARHIGQRLRPDPFVVSPVEALVVDVRGWERRVLEMSRFAVGVAGIRHCEASA